MLYWFFVKYFNQIKEKKIEVNKDKANRDTRSIIF